MADDDQFSTPVPQTAHKYRHLHHGTESRGTDLLTKTPAAESVAKVGGTSNKVQNTIQLTSLQWNLALDIVHLC